VTRVDFPVVTIRCVRRDKCGKCGKRTRRTLKLWQTRNPLNRNAAGVPKTEREILVELNEELAEKLRQPLLCSACEYEQIWSRPPGEEVK